jgi:predicted aspartyl protease
MLPTRNLKLALKKSDVKQYLQYRPKETTLLLVPKKHLHGLQYILTDCAGFQVLPPNSKYYKEMNQSFSAPTTIVSVLVPTDTRTKAKCNSINNTNDKHLMFNATISGKRVRVWFDTGATHCFAGEMLKNLLNLTLKPSHIKGVETANGHNNQVLASST